MPEVEISIGGRVFDVACQEGEEHFLRAAAKLLDNEASALSQQMGRLSEARLLLMAGLMLADKMSGLQDKHDAIREMLATQEQLIAELRAQSPAPASEVSTAELEALVARAESMADSLETGV